MQQISIDIIIPLLTLPPLLLILWRIGIRRIKTYHSPLLGKIEVYKKYNGEKLLTINTYAQGVSTINKSIEQSYWYKIAGQAVKHAGKEKQPEVLMLGLGANTISNLIAKQSPKIHQTIVEIDEFIIQACKDHFKLDQLPNHTLIQTDVYKLVDKKQPFDKKFDVIIVDVFTGKPPYVSLDSNKPNFIEKLLPFLKKEGMIIFNRPGNTEEARADSNELKNYLSTLFKNTKLFDINDPRGYRNNVITGSIVLQN